VEVPLMMIIFTFFREIIFLRGLGALHALGLKVQINDAISEPPIIYGKHLPLLVTLRYPEDDTMWKDLSVEIACDVNTPFVGPLGATYVCVDNKAFCDFKTFSGQKGANEEIKEVLERGMQKAASLLKELRGVDVSSVPGITNIGNA
jgi:glycerate kinase